MILLLDTSTPMCRLSLVGESDRWDSEWLAERTLAIGLLSYLTTELQSHDCTLQDISGIGVYQGPGSFTGLRIGLTVLNTIADSEQVPIVGCVGDDWQVVAIDRLASGDNDHIVMPHYGSDAHITMPRK